MKPANFNDVLKDLERLLFNQGNNPTGKNEEPNVIVTIQNNTEEKLEDRVHMVNGDFTIVLTLKQDGEIETGMVGGVRPLDVLKMVEALDIAQKNLLKMGTDILKKRLREE